MPPSKPFVLFFNAIRHAQPIYSKLQEVAHTDNIFAIYRTSASGAVSTLPYTHTPIHPKHGSLKSTQIAGPFDAEFISRLPPSCKYICHNRTSLPAAQAAGAEYVSFETLISQSDVVSVHVPLTNQTRHLINAAVLGRMKVGVVMINTARGAVVDEVALADALTSGHVAAVGLEMYERDPTVDERLGGHERALLLPHVGTHSVESLGKMEAWAMENMRRAVVGAELLSPEV
ncbi:hypothetical protein BO82DRAFT_403518 [Aspergillus uvarum CBS 121591]|uniref:D-isomer specific 2-hydroxyacid dehydrogenase NAD-binding domain-containing protein n=1 Tax=Aspergillus uvarum CBS 121591 TaxID=1448315 RepID=A0A319C9B3_9EURO|nr:hypothetical protein BO82DRAFT_403518 [Aspergillus uvarum CBS 121591]PYH80287.1 hypothetical protein BO82DRAFT_403518 [Aspergillus uvarum CBS 121591]